MGNGKKVWNIVQIAAGVFLFGAIIWTLRDIAEKRWNTEEKVMEESSLILYEGPKSLKDASSDDLKNTSEEGRSIGLMHCTDTKIAVDGQECYVYDTNVNHTRQWVANYLPPLSRTPVAYFDFEGRVKIEIEVPGREIDTVKISPLAYGIEPEVNKEAHTVSFTVTEPDNYTVMFNDSPERAVHIFAGSIEQDRPDFDDEKVIYIGPGEWDIESIVPEDGQIIYLSGGAVVHGMINANYAKDIIVMGRGIIDGSHLAGWKGKEAYIPLKFDHCSNITIKGIIVLNSNAWVCQAFDSKDGIIDGVKVISARPNGDGISLQSCENYSVSNCFVRSWDDSLVVKNYDGSSRKISFENMQLWTDLAQSMEIGYETNKGQKENVEITDVSFRNITVLHNFHKPIISIHNADDALISDVLFENITVEDAQMGSGDGDEMPYLIDMHIAQNGNWSSTKERGRIEDVTIRNVNVLAGKECTSRIKGYDETHKIKNVSLQNLEVLGKKITDLSEGGFEVDENTTENIYILDN